MGYDTLEGQARSHRYDTPTMPTRLGFPKCHARERGCVLVYLVIVSCDLIRGWEGRKEC